MIMLMKYMLLIRRIIMILFASTLLVGCAFAASITLSNEQSSQKELTLDSVITQDSSGRITYIPDAQGNKLPDFSYAGYQKSEQPIPLIKSTLTIQPIAGDNTAHIQQAIDKLAMLALDKDDFRGALLLDRGRYLVSGQLTINHSGIVLRGVGQQESDTVIIATGTNKRSLIHVAGSLTLTNQKKLKQQIMGDYIPVGSRSVTVANVESFSVGQSVIIFRPATAQWIADIGMDEIADRENGKSTKQWTPKRYGLRYEREITHIKGNTIFLDIPLVQMMQAEYGGGYIYPVKAKGRINNIGIENMLLVSEYQKGNINQDEAHSWSAIEISDSENVWVSDITSKHFARSLVSVKRQSRFVTVRDSSSLDPASKITGMRRYSFDLEGSQALFLRCFARNGRHDFVTSSRVTGPNAFVYSQAVNTHSDIGPHHRWATGTLYDNVKGGMINIQDRGNYGSGHGWSGAQQVLWNTEALQKSAVQSPPTAINWSIGHVGKQWTGRFERTPGVWISPGEHVKPQSLFVQQLIDRIGKEQANLVLAKRLY